MLHSVKVIIVANIDADILTGRFSKSLFIEDWQKKKARADEEPMLALGDKKIKPRRNSMSNSQLNINNKKILRTLRFEQHNQKSDGKWLWVDN